MKIRIIASILFVITISTAFAEEKLVVATWNLRWFFDDDQSDNFRDVPKQNSAPTIANWKWKVEVAAKAIAEFNPDLLALQEIENEKVLNELVAAVREKHSLNYKVLFVQGEDRNTEQDVAFLLRDTETISVIETRRFAMQDKYKDKTKYKMPSKHALTILDVRNSSHETERIKVVNVHLLASGAAAQRGAQGRVIREEIKSWVKKDNVIVLGDFNTHIHYGDPEEKGEGVGVVRGLETSSKKDDLFDLDHELSAEARQTHRDKGHLDRILIANRLQGAGKLTINGIVNGKDHAIRGDLDKAKSKDYWKTSDDERDVSDHFPLIATFAWENE